MLSNQAPAPATFFRKLKFLVNHFFANLLTPAYLRRAAREAVIYALVMLLVCQSNWMLGAGTKSIKERASRQQNAKPIKAAQETALATAPAPAPATSSITDTAVSRQRPSLNGGRIEGNLRVFAGENYAINNQFQLTGDLYTVGTPSITVNSNASHGGTVDEQGNANPSGYQLILNSGTILPGKIRFRADALALPADLPASVPTPSGTRNVNINSPADLNNIGDWSTVRELNVSPANQTINLPPGNYGTFTLNGNNCKLVFSSGTYNFAGTINLNNNSAVESNGAVIINIGQGLNINNGSYLTGQSTHPGAVKLNVLGSTVTVDNGSQVQALLRAVNANVNLNSGTVRGQVIAGYLNINGGQIINAVSVADTAPPTINIASPLNNARTTAEKVTVAGTASDTGAGASGIDKVFVNNSPAQYNAGTGAWTFPELNLSLGANQITAKAVDLAGNEAVQNITVYRAAPPDTVPPTISIVSPANNAIVPDAQITVTGTAADLGANATGISRVTVNGRDAAYNAVTGGWTISGVALQEGENTIRAVAYDGAPAPNTAEAVINVKRRTPDTQGVALTVTAPQNNSETYDSAVTISGTAIDQGTNPAGVRGVRVNNQPAQYNPNTNQWVLENYALEIGANTITVTAEDNAEPPNQSQISLTVIRQEIPAPSITIATPSNNSATTNSLISVAGTATANSPAANQIVSVAVNGRVAGYDSASQTWTLGNLELALGSNIITATATDSWGKTATTQINVTRDPENLPPAVDAGADQTVSLTAAANLNGTAADDGLPNNSLTVAWSKIEGAGEVAFANAASAATTATFNQAGIYVLRLSANDGQYSRFDDVTVTVNPANAPPAVSAGSDQSYELKDKSINTVFDNLNDFNQRSFDAHIAIDFENIVTGTDITGTTQGGVLFETGNTLAQSAPLIVVKGDETFTSPTGFFGVGNTTNNRLFATSGSNVLSPGGLELAPGLNPAKENDDLKITFEQPVAAVGFDIIFQSLDFYSGVSVKVLGTNGETLYLSGNIPSGGAGGGAPSGKVFVGFVSARPNIKTIIVDEIDDNNVNPDCNIGFDSFRIQKVLPDSSLTLNGSVTDDGLPAGSVLTQSWSKVSGPGTVTFADINSPVTTASFSDPGTYTLRLSANDTEFTTTDETVITVVPTNKAPVVNAGADKTITLPSNVQLSGSATDDGLPAGSTLSISWSKVSGPGNVTFGAATSATTTASFSAAGTYVLRLTANDSQKTANDEVTVTVKPQNFAPVVNAGADFSITLPEAATLAGTVTDDGLPEGSTVTRTWSKTSGAGTVTFANPNATNTTATFSTAGTYVLRLRASDSQLSAFDEVTVTVNPEPPNQAPTANAGADNSATISVNLVRNPSAEAELVDGNLPEWSEIEGATWTRGAAGVANAVPAAVRGSQVFAAANEARAEIRQDVDVRAFAAGIAAGTQQFAFKAFVRSLDETAPDTARVIVEYRDAANQNTVGVLDSGEIASVSSWQLTEDTRVAPAGTGWIRVRLIATRNSGTTSDVFFDAVSLRPVGNAAVILQGATADDGRPSGSTLVSTWTKVSGSGAVVFGNANSAETTAGFTSPGTYVLRLTASDGSLSASDEMTVVVNGANAAPAVNAGADQTLAFPASVSLSGTAADDGSPAGSTVSVKWTKVSGAGVVTFGNPGSAATSASFSAPGTYILRLTAEDGEAEASDDITVIVNAPPSNQPPAVDAGAGAVITLPTNSVTLAATATDDGLPTGGVLEITWTKQSGAGAVTFANPNSANTTATFSAAGNYLLRLTATDGQYTTFDEVAVVVNAAPPTNQPPVVNAGGDQTIAIYQQASLNGTAADDGLPAGGGLSVNWTKVSGAGTVTFSSPNNLVTTASFSQTGTYTLRLTASDTQLAASDEVTVTVLENAPPPTVDLNALPDGTIITAPRDISGTVSEGIWKLEYALADAENPAAENWTTLANGSGAVSNGTLGTIDPTLMLNGTYFVRLTATNTAGQSSAVTTSVVVEGNLKVGHFTVSFEDMNVPVEGIPIQVIRTYDSRDKRKGDFGYGWQLGLKTVRAEKNGGLGLRWYQTVTQTQFPRYCVQATKPHIVSVTMPDGKVHKFEAKLAQDCQTFAPISGGNLVFVPQAGTQGKLEVVGDNAVQVAGSVPGPVDLIGFTGQGIFDSSLFRYTAKDGTQFVIDQRSGLQSVKDTNNNTLTVTNNGIFHSSGRSVSFLRDAQGRITQITDPNGNVQTYTYDTNGDLDEYKDRENNITKFDYEPTVPHHLKTIIDPLNRQAIRNEYDADGRLLKHIDVNGEEIVYTHNLAARAEIVKDRLNNETRYEYDERGNVLRKLDARGGETTYSYDANDNVLTETNANGKTTVYTYDAFDNRTSVKDPLNNTTTFTYNGLGQVLTATDPRGKVTINAYDTAGNLLSTTDADNKTTTNTYSIQNGRLTSTRDALNNTTAFDYFPNGQLKGVYDPLNNVTTYTYDNNGNRLTETQTRTLPNTQTETLTTTFEYDKLNRLTKTIYSDGTFTTVEYSATGQQRATVDQLLRRTEFDYDEQGRLIKTTYPDNTFEESTYDDEGRRLTSKDRLNRTTSFAYDELGRLIKTTYPDATFTETTYDSIGQVKTSKDARNNVTTYFYDDAGRRTSVKNALNQITEFTYDAAGNQLSMKDARNNTTAFEYDNLSRRKKTIFADATFTETTYDGLGRRIAERDQAGKITQFFYDKLGRLEKVKDALNQETVYAYNEVGQQISQTDANNHTTRYEYDQMGRRVKRILPGGQIETYAYFNDGTLQAKTDFNGKTTTFAYDLMRRLLSKTPDASLNQPTISFTYNALGQRETMTDASGVTTYNYDNRNRLQSKQTPFGTLSYTYDLTGNLKTTRSSNANGYSVDYTYDELNRLKTVKDNRLPAGANITSYNYDAAGNLQSYQYPNSITTSYNYNSLNRLTNVTTSNGASNLASYTYTLGAAGNRTRVEEASGRTVNYTYDDLYRLLTETITNDPQGGSGQVCYTYDAVGNRQTRNSNLPQLSAQSFAYDVNDRVTTDSYDNNGNTTAQNGNSFTYDFENRLTTQSGANGAIGFVYDGDGNRVSKTVGGVTTNYLVDANNHTGYAQVVEELQVGAVQKQFTFGHDLISQRIAGGSVSFYQYDGHGSVRQLTSQTGAVTDTYTYDAFGNLINRTGSTPNDYLYAGEQFDANLGFYYLRARYMNPLNGRFHSMDSYEGDSLEPATLHKYLYTANNPVDRIDPSGYAYDLPTIGAIAGVITTLAAAAISPAIINTYFSGRSGGSEPIIEIEDQPVILGGAGWDVVAMLAHQASIDFWRREANIVVKQLPPIFINEFTYAGCNRTGNCGTGLNKPPTASYLSRLLQANGSNAKHATFFVNSLLPEELNYTEIPGYTVEGSGFTLIGPSANNWWSAISTLRLAPASGVVAHEWGHTFGLEHSSKGIMYDKLNAYYFGPYLSQDERTRARENAAKFQ